MLKSFTASRKNFSSDFVNFAEFKHKHEKTNNFDLVSSDFLNKFYSYEHGKMWKFFTLLKRAKKTSS